MNTILSATTTASQLLTTTLFHPTYFPFPLALVTHAARTSLAHQNNVRATGNWHTIHWPTYFAGFLIMSWGGGIGAHLLMGLPPPQLYSAFPWIGYLTVHTVLTLITPSTLSARALDTLLLPLDTLLRINSIVPSLLLLVSHPGVNPLLRESPFLPLLVGACASAGGGIAAGTLRVFETEWGVRTPLWMKGGVRGSLDVWGGAVAAFTYCLLTASHPFYRSLLSSLPFFPASTGLGPLMSPADARAASTLVLGAIFAWRVYFTHYAGAAAPGAGVAASGKGKGKEGKGKVE